MIDCETMSISYNHVLVYKWFPGWNILWVSNDIYVLIIDRVNKKFFSNSITFLGGLHSPISSAVKFPGCVWPRVSVCTIINWHMLGYREVYITTADGVQTKTSPFLHGSHFSEQQSCTLIFSTNFYSILIFK